MSIKSTRDDRSGCRRGSRVRAPASLPDMSRKNTSFEQPRDSERKSNYPHHTLDNFLDHSVVMADRGLENGDVRKRDFAEGGEPGRFRTLTEKGLANQRKLHDSNRVKAMKRLNRLLRSTDELFKDYANVDKVKHQLLEVDRLFSDVMESHGKYHVLIDDHEERQNSSKWMNDNDATVFGFRDYVNKWINEYNKQHGERNAHENRRSDTRSNFEMQTQQEKLNEHTLQCFNNEHSRLLPNIPAFIPRVNAPDLQQIHSTVQHTPPPPPPPPHVYPSKHNTPRQLYTYSSEQHYAPSHRHQTYSHEQQHVHYEDHLELTRSRASSVVSNNSRHSAKSTSSNLPVDSTTRRRGRIRSNSDPLEHRRHSSRSSRASSKHNSSVSSSASLHLQQKAKVASLKAEAKFLKESRGTKGTEEWELAKEIAKAEAVADVYAEEEGRSSKTKHLNTSKTSHNYTDSGVGMGGRHAEESIVKLLQLQSAPTVDIDEFDGNPLEFNYFLATFKEVVEQKVDDPRGRLTRLIKFTKGEAKELIKNCIQEDPSTGYKHAMSLLKSQYGNEHFIARAYIQELRRWEPLKVGDSKAFRKFYGFLIKCKTCMTSGSYLTELNFPDILQVLQSKLPYNMQDKWNRRAVRLRTLDGREANFDDFLEIVETETMVANDPMYSREALNYINNDNLKSNNNNNNSNTNNNNKNKQIDQNKRGVSAFSVSLNQEVTNAVKEATHAQHNTENQQHDIDERIEHQQVSCIYCTLNHDIDDCPEYKKLDMKSKKAFIFRKRLCFSCYKSVTSTHTSKTCTNKRKCNVCNELHPTGLHVYTNESSPDPPIVTVATGCNVKTQGNEQGKDVNKVVSLCIVPVKVRHKLNPDNVLTMYAMLDNCSEGTFVTDDVAGILSTPTPSMSKEVAEELTSSIKRTTFSIKTLNGMSIHDSHSAEGLQV